MKDKTQGGDVREKSRTNDMVNACGNPNTGKWKMWYLPSSSLSPPFETSTLYRMTEDATSDTHAVVRFLSLARRQQYFVQIGTSSKYLFKVEVYCLLFLAPAVQQ